MVGFGLSVVLMAVASLAAINAMVAADGPVAWGAIALGQAIGSVSCIVLGYGWAVSGPAKIARAAPSARRREYADSVRVKMVLLAPACALAALTAALFRRDETLFIVAGAISFTLIGLTGNWYFIGISRPFAMLLLETMPRVLGMLVGIIMMKSGHSAIVGLICMGTGMLIAFLMVTAWVYYSTKGDQAERPPRRSLAAVFANQGHGVVSATTSGLYLAMPLAIVSIVAPAAQPEFALADRLKNQVLASLGPFVTVLQGWVPRDTGEGRKKRARVAVVASCAIAGVLPIGFVFVAPSLFHWLGDGQIMVTFSVTILVAVLTAVAVVDQVLSKAVLASFDELKIITQATAWSAMVGLPLVLIGSLQQGAAGAFAGAIAGIFLRIGLQVFGYLTKVDPLGRCNK